MKRHPKREDKKTNKTAFIKVRCTAEEKERIRSRATNAGRKYSDYCREMLLAGSVIAVPPMGDNEKEALAILRQTALFYAHISNLIKVKDASWVDATKALATYAKIAFKRFFSPHPLCVHTLPSRKPNRENRIKNACNLNSHSNIAASNDKRSLFVQILATPSASLVSTSLPVQCLRPTNFFFCRGIFPNSFLCDRILMTHELFYLSRDQILFARQPTNGLLDVSAEAVGQAHDLDLLRLLGRVREILLARDLRGVNGRLHAAQADPYLLVTPLGVVVLIDREDLAFLLLRQPEQRLYAVELGHVLPHTAAPCGS